MMFSKNSGVVTKQSADCEPVRMLAYLRLGDRPGRGVRGDGGRFCQECGSLTV